MAASAAMPFDVLASCCCLLRKKETIERIDERILQRSPLDEINLKDFGNSKSLFREISGARLPETGMSRAPPPSMLGSWRHPSHPPRAKKKQTNNIEGRGRAQGPRTRMQPDPPQNRVASPAAWTSILHGSVKLIILQVNIVEGWPCTKRLFQMCHT